VDSATYIEPRIWSGGNRGGTVAIQEQQSFATRKVANIDDCAEGNVANSVHGGVPGQVKHAGAPSFMHVRAPKHNSVSDVSITRLLNTITATQLGEGGPAHVEVAIKYDVCRLLAEAIALVSIVKDSDFAADAFGDGAALESDLALLSQQRLSRRTLCGFDNERLAPFGAATSELRAAMLRDSRLNGSPMVRVGHGALEVFTDADHNG
jgi:L-asparaginase